ncbi:MAG: hypothetical protein HRU26_10050 [Psychroserpens sp.]|nr:hypothetical protein [Psychroserpens sp.]
MKRIPILALTLILIPLFGYTQSTASKQVSQIRLEAPQLDTLKTIWLYLPKDYQESKDDYSVIYMFDAQNLFDANASFVGEWEIDEYLDQNNLQKVIVVGDQCWKKLIIAKNSIAD